MKKTLTAFSSLALSITAFIPSVPVMAATGISNEIEPAKDVQDAVVVSGIEEIIESQRAAYEEQIKASQQAIDEETPVLEEAKTNQAQAQTYVETVQADNEALWNEQVSKQNAIVSDAAALQQALQDEYEKTLEDYQSVNADLETKQTELSQAQDALTALTSEIEDLQKQQEALENTNPDLKDKDDEETAALSSKVNELNTQLKNTEAEITQKTEEYNAALANCDSFADEVNTAQAEYDAVNAQYQSLLSAYNSAVAEHEAFMAYLDSEEYAQAHAQEIAQANAALTNAQTALQTAQEELSKAEQTVAEKEDALANAGQNANETKQELENIIAQRAALQTELDNVKSQLDDAQKQFNSNADSITQLESEVEAAKDIEQKAWKSLEDLDAQIKEKREEVSTLSSQIAALSSKVETYQKALDAYNQGSEGFFSYLIEQNPDDEDAQKALAIMQDTDMSTQNSQQTINLGELIDPTTVSNATNLDNMRAALETLNRFNELREANGLSELLVSSALTAISQKQLNWSAVNGAHSEQYYVGENLAFGYEDPYVGWYDEELQIINQLKKEGHTLEEIEANGLGIDDVQDKTSLKDIYATGTGHYFNIVDTYYTLTGVSQLTITEIDNFEGYEFIFDIVDSGQTFAGPYMGYSGVSFEEYYKTFMTYYDSIQSAMEDYEGSYDEDAALLTSLKAQLQDAQGQYNYYSDSRQEKNMAWGELNRKWKTKAAELDALQATQNDLQSQIDGYKAQVTDLEGQIQEKTNAINELGDSSTKKAEEELSQAKEALTKAQETVTQAQKALETAQQNLQKTEQDQENTEKLKDLKSRSDEAGGTAYFYGLETLGAAEQTLNSKKSLLQEAQNLANSKKVELESLANEKQKIEDEIQKIAEENALLVQYLSLKNTIANKTAQKETDAAALAEKSNALNILKEKAENAENAKDAAKKHADAANALQEAASSLNAESNVAAQDGGYEDLSDLAQRINALQAEMAQVSAQLEQNLAQVQEALNKANTALETEQAKMDKLLVAKKEKEELLAAFEADQKAQQDRVDTLTKLDTSTVTLDDQENILAAIDHINAFIEENESVLNAESLDELEAQKAHLEVLKASNDLLSEMLDTIEALPDTTEDPKAVTPDDTEYAAQIKDFIEKLDANETEKAKVSSELLDKLESVYEATTSYKTLAGEGTAWDVDEDTLTFVFNGVASYAQDVYVDDALVDSSNYTIVSGSTILTFNHAYLSTLDKGSHSVKVQYEKYAAAATFSVEEAQSEKDAKVVAALEKELEALTDPKNIQAGDTDTANAIASLKEKIAALSDSQKKALDTKLLEKLENAQEAVANYKVVEGEAVSWKQGNDLPQIVVDGKADVQEVLVNGKAVESSKYVLSKDGTVLTFSEEYLSSLPAGEYVVDIVYPLGNAQAVLTIEKSEPADTATTTPANTADATPASSVSATNKTAAASTTAAATAVGFGSKQYTALLVGGLAGVAYLKRKRKED